jgi:hypothetical protein
MPIICEVPGLPGMIASLQVAASSVDRAVGAGVLASTAPAVGMVQASAASDGLEKASRAVRRWERPSIGRTEVEIYVTRGVAVYALDAETFRHPVFGNMSNWVTQYAENRFFWRAVDAASATAGAAVDVPLSDMLETTIQ